MKRPAALAMTFVFGVALVGLYLWLTDEKPVEVVQAADQSDELDAEGLIAIDGKAMTMPGHMVAGAFGCQSRDTFDRITHQLREENRAAASELLKDGVNSGECALFKKGQRVEVATTKVGLAKVHRQGDSSEYWTLSEAVSL